MLTGYHRTTTYADGYEVCAFYTDMTEGTAAAVVTAPNGRQIGSHAERDARHPNLTAAEEAAARILARHRSATR